MTEKIIQVIIIKKAQEFHTKFLAVVKKYDAAVLQFRAEMEK